MHSGKADRSGPVKSSHSVRAEPFDRAQDRLVEAGAALRRAQGERWGMPRTLRSTKTVRAEPVEAPPRTQVERWRFRGTLRATKTVQAEPVEALLRTPLERVQSQGERFIHQGAQAIGPGDFAAFYSHFHSCQALQIKDLRCFSSYFLLSHRAVPCRLRYFARRPPPRTGANLSFWL